MSRSPTDLASTQRAGSGNGPRKPRVLIVHDYGSLVGGAEHIALALRDGLRERGYDTRLFTSTANATSAPLVADETCFGTTGPVRRLLQVANPHAARRLRNVVASFQPDVIHLRMFMTQLSPLVLPPVRGATTLLHVVNYDLVCPLNTKVLPDGSRCTHAAGIACRSAGCVSLLGAARFTSQRALWRRGRSAVDLVAANSEWVSRRLGEEGIPVDAVVWNGVPERPPRPPLTGDPTISYAGRLYPKKGVDVLLRALVHVPGARLVIAGDGPERMSLEQLAKQLELLDRVSFVGHRPREAAERTIETAWIHAVPSVWEEPFGITAAEALMRGTGVVASNAGGITEFIEDGHTGLLVPPGQPDALAAALRRVLADRDLAERLGAEGRRFALSELTERSFLDRVEALYARLVGVPVGSAADTGETTRPLGVAQLRG